VDGPNHLFIRIQELLEAQRRLVADAAHELRTPLAVVAAQAHVLEHAQNQAQRFKASRELQQGVDRGAQVIRQLLVVARLEAREQSFERAPLDMADLAQKRVAALVPQALAKGQDLGYEGPASLAWEGDASILGSALDNLLVNALQYTPPGTTITLRLVQDIDGVLLEIEDTGPGIPAEFHESIFDRFTRLPGTQEPGTGLGLAIVRRSRNYTVAVCLSPKARWAPVSERSFDFRRRRHHSGFFSNLFRIPGSRARAAWDSIHWR